MDTIVKTTGRYLGGRSTYFLNDEATAEKLKQAASNLNLEVTNNSGSKTINCSTGSYITTVLPLVKAWQDIEGGDIDRDLVDGMVINVIKVKTFVDLGDTIEKYLVKLRVEGKLVTVTMFDTTLSILVQAGTMLEPYCERVLIPYLEKEVRRNLKSIQELNEQFAAIVVPKGTTRKQQRQFMKQASILELPPDPSPSWLMNISPASTPATNSPAPPQQLRSPHPSPAPSQGVKASYIALPGRQRLSEDLHVPSQVHEKDIPLTGLMDEEEPSKDEDQSAVDEEPSKAEDQLAMDEEEPSMAEDQSAVDSEDQNCPLNPITPSLPPSQGLHPEEVLKIPNPKEQWHPTLATQAPTQVAGPMALNEADSPSGALLGPLEEAGPLSLLEAVYPAGDPQEIPWPLVTPAGLLAIAFSSEQPEKEQLQEETVACYPCQECNSVFSSEDCVARHVENVHEKVNNQRQIERNSLTASGRPIFLSPNFAQKHTKLMKNLNQDHVDCSFESSESEDSDDESNTFTCDLCNYESNQEAVLIIHKKNVHKEHNKEVLRYECDKCDYVDKSADNLLSHKLRQHKLRIQYDCKNCVYEADNGEDLKTHMNQEHKHVKITFVCDICEYEFSHKSTLLAHKNDVHRLKLLCQECNYQSSSEQNLKAHNKDEHVEYITPCAVCGETLRNVASLQVHILSKHCTQSDLIVKLLKEQEQRMTAMQQQINNMALKQIGVIGDIKQVKEKITTNHVSPVHGPPPPGSGHALSSPPQAPVASYAHIVQAPAPGGASMQLSKPQGPKLTVKKVSYITDSIGHNVIFEELERITKTKIKRRKAYGSVRASGQLHPDSNFAEVVPKEMEDNKPDVLVLQRDSITLTNLPRNTTEEYAKQQVLLSSYNMVTAATEALAANPQLQQVILMEAAPRYDDKQELNMFANQMIHQAKEDSSSTHKAKVTIGVHNLECEGGLRQSRYGDGRRGQVDMIHMRGTSGKVAYTRSVAAILAGAGLTTSEEAAMVARNREIKIRSSGDRFETQGRRNRSGARQQQQLSPFQLATKNRFEGFLGNC